eukprot:COSAG02_NODE_2142_length_9685_cov_83.241707_2_plen_39_part_00
MLAERLRKEATGQLEVVKRRYVLPCPLLSWLCSVCAPV